MVKQEILRSPEIGNQPGILFGEYVPQTVLTNEEIASWDVKTSSGKLLSAEDIHKKVGVLRRYVAGEDETVFSMGVEASKPILDQGGDIGVVLWTTNDPQEEGNLSRRFSEHYRLNPYDKCDFYAACSGLVYSLSYIHEKKEEFLGKRVHLVSSEKLSHIMANLKDPDERKEDPGMCQTIFTDWATAMNFRYPTDLIIRSTVNFKFNEGSDALLVPVHYEYLEKPYRVVRVPPSPTGKVRMEGGKVYELVLRNIPKLINTAIAGAGLRPEEIDWIILHQASLPVVEGVARRLPELRDKFIWDLEDGNSSSASIPRAWMRATAKGMIKRGDKLVLAGVGAGLFSSVAVVELG